MTFRVSAVFHKFLETLWVCSSRSVASVLSVNSVLNAFFIGHGARGPFAFISKTAR
jgi:hypothetical protein